MVEINWRTYVIHHWVGLRFLAWKSGYAEELYTEISDIIMKLCHKKGMV